ncbi:atypical chemokine receptor 4b [Oncorhynchus kisutch]|uniref:Atypical chemokine receptor 4b n=1 Tax=Oncorhynchus kisutch TaxID=8019 RepID=A0A8C7IQG6_ONCKI|nr:atypical chemokine receptor 4 [Oncorhynchus kisutch]
MEMDEEDYNYDFGNSSSNDSDDYDDYHSVCDKAEVRSFGRLFLPVVYGLALVVGVAGNALVVVVYASPRRLRTLTDVCILNLAVADLLLLFTLPFWAADAVHGWQIGVAACKLTSFLYTTNFSCGMLLLACISVDRYRALAHNAGGRAGSGPRARRQWILVCVVVWTTAICLGLPDMVLFTVKNTSHRLACTAIYPSSMARPAKAALELLEVLLSFLLPFLVMVVCYCLVGRALARVGAGVRKEKRWRALRVLLAVVGVFLFTQLPYNLVKLWRTLDVIYGLVTDCDLSKGLDQALQVTESLALTHCCINPMLYTFIGSSFRGYVLRVAKSLGQRLGRRMRGGHHGNEEPAVEISLNTHNSAGHTHSHSVSEDEDTSTFTI